MIDHALKESEVFFSKAFAHLDQNEIEAYHRSVFMNMDTRQAADLRRDYFRRRLRHMGEGVSIGIGVSIINPQYISLADHVHIGDHCTLAARSRRGITICEKATLMHGVYLDTETENGYIDIGARAYIGTGSCLHGHQGLEIGDDSLLAQNITITPYSHKFDNPDLPIIQQGGNSKKLVVGKDCYIGMGVCVMYSGDIGDGSVIGAGSVVVRPIPPYSVAVGVPARVVHKRGERSAK